MHTVVVSVRLEERLVRMIDAAGRERSEVVREAVEDWFRRRRVTEMVREHEEAYRRAPVAPGEFDWLLEAGAWPDGEPVIGSSDTAAASTQARKRSSRTRGPKKRKPRP